LKSSAQFEGSCEKEIAVEVTVMVVGSKFLFLSSVSGKRGGGSGMMRSGRGTIERGGGYQKRGKSGTPLPLPSPPRGG